MSKKFLTAKFYDVSTGDWEPVTPEEYTPDIHEGLIQCPRSECSGALRHISDYLTRASNRTTSHHFKTDITGEPHEKNCPDEAGVDHGRILKMEDALAQGRTILMNINFVTSFNKDLSRLSKYIAEKAMPKIGGEYRPNWIRKHTNEQNKRQYSTFSVKDIEQVSARLREFKLASEKVLGTEDRSKITVSYLHGALPWASFYSKNANGSIHVNKNDITPQDVFESLYGDMASGKNPDRLWRPAPVSRMQVEPRPNLQSKWNEVKTDTFGHDHSITIEDTKFKIQDVLIVTDKTLLPKIQSASSISLIATPYIVPEDVQENIDNKSGYVHLNWPITSEDQIILS